MNTVDDFICEFPSKEYQIAVANTDRPQPMINMFEDAFEKNVDTLDIELESVDKNVVLLLDSDKNVVATSPLEEIENTILLVNSDLYRTGSVGLDKLEVPDVLEELTDTNFQVSGYPESNKEKLPLIVISRRIEQYAYYKDGGTLRSSFQRLSRLKDESGTYRVYRSISETDTDVHIYGIPDVVPDMNDLDLTVHGGLKDDFKNSWFVSYENEDFCVALAAYEIRPNYWNSVWTFDRDKVQQLNEHIRTTL